MRNERRIGSRLFMALVFLFLYAPIFVLIVFSFNSSKSRAVWTGFSLDWYRELFQDSEILSALSTTLSVSVLAGFLASAALLTGCGSGGESSTSGSAVRTGREVNVCSWGEYIDTDLIGQFEKQTGIKVNYTTTESNETLYSLLKTGGSTYDVVVPSDYMLSRLIEEGMLEKLDFSNIPNFKLIGDDYKNLPYDPENLYSVPYTWGTTGIIYNTKMVTEPVDSWSILFDEKYKGEILMIDNPRDAFAVALSYLGYSINTTDKKELMEAYDLLVKQKDILQAYVMDQIFDKLEGGEAAMGVYYAGDFLSMKENNPDLAFAIPKEGANFFVDAMCVPKGARNKTEAEEWINFMCSYDASMANLDYIWYASPNPQVMKDYVAELDEETAAVLNPSKEELSRCQMFVNLPKETLELYDELWVLLKS